MIPAYRVFNAVMKAMAQALPDKVIATGFDCTTAFCLSSLGEKGYSVYLEIFGGGYGASRGADGCDAVDSPLSNCSNAPVESLDIDYDFFRIVGYELAPDSFGLGARRGGAGFTRRCEILRDDVQLAIYSDRFRLAPEGLLGGPQEQSRRRPRQGRHRRDVRRRRRRLRPCLRAAGLADRPRPRRRAAHARPAGGTEAGGRVARARFGENQSLSLFSAPDSSLSMFALCLKMITSAIAAAKALK
jgi:N-methylhydantoinase B/oxoprolinase/acetone carboxylase alpha subunit